MGLPVRGADHRHSVLSRQSQAREARGGDGRARGRARDHDVPEARGGACLLLRLRALQDAPSGAISSAPSGALIATYYRPVPFSRRFVRHIAGWYAQKHPDEDFAETFAVWLTPRLQWRAALPRMGGDGEAPLRRPHRKHLGSVDPVRAAATRMCRSRRWTPRSPTSTAKPLEGQEQPIDLPLDNDLGDIFKISKRRKRGTRPAADFLRENRRPSSTR